jgi:hypothetical protein
MWIVREYIILSGFGLGTMPDTSQGFCSACLSDVLHWEEEEKELDVEV